MAFFEKDKGGVAVWLPIMTGPIFSLVVFVLTYWLDPLSLKQTSGIPAFFSVGYCFDDCAMVGDCH